MYSNTAQRLEMLEEQTFSFTPTEATPLRPATGPRKKEERITGIAAIVVTLLLSGWVYYCFSQALQGYRVF